MLLVGWLPTSLCWQRALFSFNMAVYVFGCGFWSPLVSFICLSRYISFVTSLNTLFSTNRSGNLTHRSKSKKQSTYQRIKIKKKNKQKTYPFNKSKKNKQNKTKQNKTKNQIIQSPNQKNKKKNIIKKKTKKKCRNIDNII